MMRLNGKYVAILFAVILFAGIGGANAAGLWVTESSKEPTLIKEGEFAGMADPGDIRGSYSFGDLETAFDVPATLIAEAFGIETETPRDILCKDLEEIYPASGDDLEIGTGSVRQFVALYTGLPYDGDDGFPSTAVRVLRQEGIWTDELSVEFEDRMVQIENTGLEGSGESVQGAGEASEDHEETIGVKGKTTAEEVIEWGISQVELEKILGVTIDNVNLTIRDICTNNNISFSEKKEAINSLLEP